MKRSSGKIAKILVGIIACVTLFSSVVLTSAEDNENTTEYLSDNLLANGDFTLGKKFWSDVENNNEINVTIVTDASDAPVAGKPYADIEIISGYPSYNNSRTGYYPAGTYKASFWMKKDNSNVSPYNLQPMNACNAAGYWYQNYGSDVRAKLSTEWQYFEYYVTTDTDNNNVNFQMQTDNRPGHLYIADVKVQRVLDVPQSTEAPVYATIPPVTDGINRETKFIYVFAGQSNMVGLNGQQIENDEVDPRITKMDLNNYSNWLPGVENIHSTSSTPSNGTSPAKSIATEILKVVPGNVEIGLVGCAESGTSLAQWKKDSTDMFNSSNGQMNLHSRMLERIKETQKVGVVKGIFWHQGEADSGNGNYEQELSALIDQIRIDIGVPDLPFIMGQIGTNGVASGAVNGALEFIKYFKKNTNVATSENLVLVDNVHYNAESQVEYGKRYAAAYLALNPDLSEPAESTNEPTATPNVSSATPTGTPSIDVMAVSTVDVTVAPTIDTTPVATNVAGVSATPTISPTTTPDINEPISTPVANKVKKVKFAKKKVKVKVGKKAVLKVKLTPKKLTKAAKKVKWSIDKKGKKVVKFVKKAKKLNGKLKAKIKAKKKGEAEITCKAPSGKKSVCKIIVK